MKRYLPVLNTIQSGAVYLNKNTLCPCKKVQDQSEEAFMFS